MSTLDESFPALQAALIERYGHPAGLPPAEPLLASAAALLMGDPSASEVARARTALVEADLLDPETLVSADLVVAEDHLRENGFPLPRKAIAGLQRLARWLVEAHQGNGDSLADAPTESLRDELAAINGIGRATADALLLYALRRPVYPLDRASYRVFVRHGWADPSADYEDARETAERPLRDDPDGLARLKIFMEQVGREFCRVRAPRCDRCPLRPWLPDTGPIEPDA